MKLKLALIAVGAVALSLTIMRTTVQAVDDSRSCASVYHVHFPTADESASDVTVFVPTDGIDGSTYKVEYRLRSTSGASWGSWTTPSESVEASNGIGDYGYRYITSDVDAATYDLVQWQVITNGHTGTNSATAATAYSVDGSTQTTYVNLDSSACSVGNTPAAHQWQGFLGVWRKPVGCGLPWRQAL